MYFVTDAPLTGHEGETLVEIGEILTGEALQALADRHARAPHEDDTLPGVWCMDAATAQRVQMETILKWNSTMAADLVKRG